MEQESAAISLHQIAICSYAINREGRWFTSTMVAASKANISPRTIRRHLRRLVEVGILERRKAFGGCRYRVLPVEGMNERAKNYLDRLSALWETFERRRRRSVLSSIVGMMLSV